MAASCVAWKEKESKVGCRAYWRDGRVVEQSGVQGNNGGCKPYICSLLLTITCMFCSLFYFESSFIFFIDWFRVSINALRNEVTISFSMEWLGINRMFVCKGNVMHHTRVALVGGNHTAARFCTR